MSSDRSYATHDADNIKGFFGEFRWLSNFYPCRIEYKGLVYPSTENAYQASKVTEASRVSFTSCPAWESKKLWKNLPLMDKSPEEWDARKHAVMVYLTLEKYNKHPELREKLLATGDKYLEETNHWGMCAGEWIFDAVGKITLEKYS